MKTKYDREAMKAEQERIKDSNNQYMISILKSEGIDASEVSRFDFDKLLRIQREVSVNERRMKELIFQYNTILNPYRPVVIANAPTTTEPSSEDATSSTTESPIVESTSTTATPEIVPEPTTDIKATKPQKTSDVP
jgi:hypothetical protein